MKARQALIVSAFVLALVPAAARAVPVANGTPFKVSSCDTCKKRLPAVAGVPTGTAAGTFLMTWESTSPADSLGISGRFFLKTGAPKSADFLVNKDTVAEQHEPAVAADAAGNYVVAWSATAGTNTDVLVQRYKATGVPNGAAVVVNVDDPHAPAAPQDIAPAVAAAADGSFVVSWIRIVPPDPHSNGVPPVVMARRYGKTGAPLGPPVQLSTGLVAGSRPGLCLDTTGRAVVAWTNIDAIRLFEPSLMGVSMRRLSPAGAALGTELVIAQPLSTQSSTAVACGTGGTFVVSWSTDQAPAVDNLDIVAQRFTTLGNRNGKIFRINSITGGEQSQPAMFADASGNFTVTWQSRLISTNTGDSILGRRYLASATADGADFLVTKRASPLDGRPILPRVANLGASGFVIVWAQGNAVLQARRYKLTP
jgi:hypothetical protein